MRRIFAGLLMVMAAALAVGLLNRESLPGRTSEPAIPVAEAHDAPVASAITPIAPEDRGLSAAMRVPTLASASRSGPYRPTDWPDLPPRDAPVAAVFDTLRDRARRGDAGAACRLVFDLRSCRRAHISRLAIERGREVRPEGFGMPADQAGQRRLLSRCQGLGPNHFSAQYGLLKQSALAGHELSIGFFLAGELFRQETTTHLDFVDDFRAEAPRMFESALQRGSMSAAALGGLADSGAPMAFLPEAVRRNPVERQAAALLSMTAMVTQGRGPSSDAIDKMWQRARRNTTLTPEEFATAERLATERAQAWFSDSTASRAIEEASAMGAVSGRSPMDPNRLCTRGYGHPLSEQPPVKWLP